MHWRAHSSIPADRSKTSLVGRFRIGEKVGTCDDVFYLGQFGMFFLNVFGYEPALQGSVTDRISEFDGLAFREPFVPKLQYGACP